MSRKQFNKLVRDKIPEIIENDNRQYAISMLSDEEFEQALRTKIMEEAEEVVQASSEDIVKEVADLLEVLHAFMTIHSIEMDTVISKQTERRISHGAFDKHIKLLWADVTD